jgi:hypothetical protein
MLQRNMLLAAALVILASTTVAIAAELIGVPGSSVTYSSEIDAKVNGQNVPMTLTGVAVRKKLLFNVYAVGSYVHKGTPLKTAEDLAATDAPKMLHLVMERDIDGKDLGQAFADAIRLNYPAPAFDAEVKLLTDYLKSRSVKKGDQFMLVHAPGVGVECVMNGKTETVIRNVAFARAIWDIYLGPKNIGIEIKAMLTARL